VLGPGISDTDAEVFGKEVKREPESWKLSGSAQSQMKFNWLTVIERIARLAIGTGHPGLQKLDAVSRRSAADIRSTDLL
jgi:hypothetical protein